MKYQFSWKIFVLSICMWGQINYALADRIYMGECCDWSFCDGTLYLGGDWLYMKVQQEGLRAGSLVDDFPGPLKKAFPHSVEPHFKYNSGFRVNVGYEFPCDHWDLNLIYTYIPIRSDSNLAVVSNDQTPEHLQFIVPNTSNFPSFAAFGGPSGLTAMTSLFTKWKGNLSYLDLDLARTLKLCNCFSIMPHIGFRSVWMNQDFLMEGSLQNPTSQGDFVRLKFSEKLNAYGIEGGLWTGWEMGCGFSLIGHVGGSVLYSRYKVRSITEGIFETGPGVVFIIDGHDVVNTATPTVDYAVGLEYSVSLWEVLFAARVKWEQQVFFNLNQMSVIPGNFSAQGLTLGVELGF